MVAASLPSNYVACARCGKAWHVRAASTCACSKRVAQVGMDDIKPTVETARRASSRNSCVLGHTHDSKSEALACPIVYAVAANRGLTTFRPGRPGIPCFRIAPDDAGRPVYVSIDWVLVNAAGKIAALVDYKGSVATSKRWGRSGAWARGRRIIESETGVSVIELAAPDGLESALAAAKGTA